MEPIDYTMQVADPIQMALKGYADRVAMQQQDRQLGMEQQRIDLAQQAFQAEQAQIAQQQQAAAAQEAAQRAFADYVMDPNKTYEKTKAVVDANPQLAEAVMSQWKGMNDAQQAGTATFAKQLSYALGTGNTDAAKAMLSERAEAARNAGNEPEAAAYQSQLQMLDAGPEGAQAVLGTAMTALYGVLGPEDMKTHSEMVFGKQSTLADDKTKAEIAKIDAEAKKIAAETAGMSGGGGVPDKDRFDMEKKLRDEYVKNTGDFITVQDAARKLDAAEDSAAGDLSLVFSYMKMLDPGSVVREAEFANAQNAAGVPDRIRNIWNKALTGERLSPDQRAEFKAQADSLMEAARIRENEVRQGLKPTIEEYGLNEGNIFYTPEAAQDDAAVIAEAKAIVESGGTLTPEMAAAVRAIMAKGKQ